MIIEGDTIYFKKPDSRMSDKLILGVFYLVCVGATLGLWYAAIFKEETGSLLVILTIFYCFLAWIIWESWKYNLISMSVTPEAVTCVFAREGKKVFSKNQIGSIYMQNAFRGFYSHLLFKSGTKTLFNIPLNRSRTFEGKGSEVLPVIEVLHRNGYQVKNHI